MRFGTSDDKKPAAGHRFGDVTVAELFGLQWIFNVEDGTPLDWITDRVFPQEGQK